jgi:hypothetical protein
VIPTGVPPTVRQAAGAVANGVLRLVVAFVGTQLLNAVLARVRESMTEEREDERWQRTALSVTVTGRREGETCNALRLQHDFVLDGLVVAGATGQPHPGVLVTRIMVADRTVLESPAGVPAPLVPRHLDVLGRAGTDLRVWVLSADPSVELTIVFQGLKRA